MSRTSSHDFNNVSRMVRISLMPVTCAAVRTLRMPAIEAPAAGAPTDATFPEAARQRTLTKRRRCVS
ncbi:MAG TPA: hypothetical protein VKA74_05380, partial [Myxococcota bacterium]|nr:hypothetical protein [Myxococcota bacterium]